LGNTLYYVRSYATNSQGTSYGNEVQLNSALYIGSNYGGGIIFYIDGTGLHGLISATTDQSTGVQWGCGTTTIFGDSPRRLGQGKQIPPAIVNGCSDPV